jgi:hypothetical protein
VLLIQLERGPEPPNTPTENESTGPAFAPPAIKAVNDDTATAIVRFVLRLTSVGFLCLMASLIGRAFGMCGVVIVKSYFCR